MRRSSSGSKRPSKIAQLIIPTRLCHQPTVERAGRKELPPLLGIPAGKATELLSHPTRSNLFESGIKCFLSDYGLAL